MEQQEEIVLYIMRQLASFRDRKQIAKVIAERAVIDYNEAEQFVRSVEKKHRRQIAMARLPILLVAGGLTAVVGLGLSATAYANMSDGFYSPNTIITLVFGLFMLLGGVVGSLAAVYPIIEK